MVKALGSRIRISAFDTDVSMDYYREVGDLLFSEPVKALADWKQHMHVSRLQHSVNVSYYSFLLCRKLGLNARAAARGGLLHDLFFYDWAESKGDRTVGHIKYHPCVALENAEKLTELTDMERDIIAKHMWPMSAMPKYRETFIVSMVDKLSATIEFGDYFRISLFCPDKISL